MKLFLPLALAALVASCALAQPDDGTAYNPIQCSSTNTCLCTGAGSVQCSKCPDDGGSPFVNQNVCWCSGIPGGGVSGTGSECNPLKTNGPAAKTPDDGTAYNPILCEAVGECACGGQGDALCALCADDTGSQNQFKKVCVCENIPGGGVSGTGRECNPNRTNGPSKSTKPSGCRRRRRRRRRL